MKSSSSISPAYLLGLATGHPELHLNQMDICGAAQYCLQEKFPSERSIWRTHKNAGIDKRYFAVSLEWIMEKRGFRERNETYVEKARALLKSTCQDLFEKTGISASEVTHIMLVTTTGVATPSLDSLLLNELDFNRNVQRYPLWGLGCAGGAAGMARAGDLARAHPDNLVLLLSIELASIAFAPDDYSRANVVASGLFGDGSAAVLVGGKKYQSTELVKVTDTYSFVWPNYEEAMGWNISELGLQLLLDVRIPEFIKAQLPIQYQDLRKKWELDESQALFPILHPAGPKILREMSQIFQVDSEVLNAEWECLRECGNMSSTSVLHVLERKWKGMGQLPPHSIMVGLGPGFAMETVHLEA